MTFDYYFNIFFLSSHSPLIFTFPEPLKNSTLVQRSDASELSFFYLYLHISVFVLEVSATLAQKYTCFSILNTCNNILNPTICCFFNQKFN